MGTTRECSKVLLVDEHGRVLLFSGIDRTKPHVAPWWFAVGGALEPGEAAEAAAVRETFEETGLVIDDPGPVVFTREFSWEFEGESFDQTEWFFLVRTHTFEPSSSNWTPTESATIRAHRWWSIAELRATTEAVFPEDLADRLERLTA
jgi:8-oxo-dGTP pyrophosphatase MutT (NUDIX family)